MYFMWKLVMAMRKQLDLKDSKVTPIGRRWHTTERAWLKFKSLLCQSMTLEELLTICEPK